MIYVRIRKLLKRFWKNKVKIEPRQTRVSMLFLVLIFQRRYSHNDVIFE